MADSQTVELLDAGSLFLYVATPDDIEHERNQMEYIHDRQLAVHAIETVTHSGVRCTRVTWQVM